MEACPGRPPAGYDLTVVPPERTPGGHPEPLVQEAENLFIFFGIFMKSPFYLCLCLG